MNKNRIIYLDYLKVFAIFSIIAMHIAMFWGDVSVLNYSMHVLSQIGRFAVPMFLMVSGVLLLNRDYGSFKAFFIKKSVKIAIPFFFWTLIVIILSMYINNITTFDYNTLSYISANIFNFGILWYFWMMIGVYLALPVINEYVKNTGLDGIEYFIVIAIIASVFYQFCKIFNFYSYIDFRFFIGPIFYILLGYYLHNKKFNISDNKIILAALIVFIATSLLKTGLHFLSGDFTIFYALNNHFYDAGKNIFLDTYLDLGILEIVHTSSLFLLFRYLDCSKLSSVKNIVFNDYIVRLFTSIARSTWGIYCSHAIFLIIIPIFTAGIKLSGTKTVITIIALSVLVLFLGHVITLALSKIPYLNRISGYS